MMAFIDHHSATVKPFKWIYDAKIATLCTFKEFLCGSTSSMLVTVLT